MDAPSNELNVGERGLGRKEVCVPFTSTNHQPHLEAVYYVVWNDSCCSKIISQWILSAQTGELFQDLGNI